MRKTRIALAAAALAALWFVPAVGQKSAELLLEAAKKKELLEGDLDAAIQHYKEIVSQYSDDRPAAAKALVQLGLCYEKRGEGGAREAYRKVVESYPEQRAEVAMAKERLAGLGDAPEAVETPRFRKIHIPINLASGTFGAQLSPDGKTLAFSSGGAIWAVPIPGKVDPNVAGEPVRLTPPMGAMGFGLAWSGDGRWIAFNAGADQIYVVPAQGGQPARVGVQPSRGSHSYNYRLSLSPEGKSLAFANMEAEILTVNTVSVAGGVPKPLTGGMTREPAYSPDGKRIAYVQQYPTGAYSRRSEIRVIPAGGGASVLVTPVPNRARSPVWSPDGRMIAFLLEPLVSNFSQELWIVPVSEQGRATGEPASMKLPRETYQPLAGWAADHKIGLLFGSPERRAIYTVPAAGGKATQVTPAAWVLHPRWSPDGSRIWMQYAEISFAIGSVPPSGGEVTTVRTGTQTPVQGVTPGGGIAISPDGKTIVFSGYTNALRGVHLWRMPLSGGEPVQITQSPEQDRFPTWCSEGNLIAFLRGGLTEEKQYFSNVFAVPAAGGEVRRITSEADAVSRAGFACSPDGRWIAHFAEDKTIRVKPMTGGAPRVVAKVDGVWGHCDIAWSPDGMKLAYSAAGKLWILSLDGGNPAEVETGLQGRITGLSWSPDGDKLAFHATQGGEPELWLMEDFLPLVAAARAR